MKKAKQILSIVLVLMMLFSMSSAAVSAYVVPDGYAVAESETVNKEDIDGDVIGLIGDANQNDIVNVRDATLIQKYAASLETLNEVQFKISDVNFDTKVNVRDATAIQKWVAGIVIPEPVGRYFYTPAETTAAPTTAPVTTVPVTTVPVTTVPATTVPATTVPATTVPATTVPATTVPVTTVPATTVPATTVPATTVPATTVPATTVPVTTAPATTAPATTVPATTVPVTTAPVETEITVYFSNNRFWGEVYAYYWGVENSPEWPGNKMTFVETNSLGQDVYSAVIPAGVTGLIFDGGKDQPQTVDITENIVNGKGFYCTDEVEGKWEVGVYDYIDTDPVDPTTAAPTTAPATTAPATTAPATTVPATTAPVVEKSNYIIRGSMNGWDESGVMMVDGDGASITYELAAGDHELKVYDSATGTWYGNGGTFTDTCEGWTMRDTDGNLKFTVTGGTYKFTVKFVDSKVKLTVTKVVEVTTTAPVTTAPATTVPATTVPATTVPATTVPATTVPVTTAPATTAPATTAPATTAPATTVPATTAPATTAPATTAPATTVPVTTAPVETEITVYFSNNRFWGEVYAYYWGVENSPEWPGNKMTFVETNSLGQDVYSAVIPAGVTGLIFDGGKDQPQTVDIKENIVNGKGFYCTDEVEGKWEVGVYDYIDTDPVDPTTAAPTTAPATTAAPTTAAPTTVAPTTAAPTTAAPTTAAPTTAAPTTAAPTTAAPTTAAPTTAAPTTAAPTTAAPTTAAPTTAAPTTAAPTTAAPTTAAPTTAAPTTDAPTTAPVVDPTHMTIYFTNTKGWENVYIYGFYGKVGVAATSEPFGAYPGTKMAYVKTNSQGQEIYAFEIPVDIDYIKFADGTSANNRTDNIPNATFSSSKNGFYLTEKGAKYWGYETYEYIDNTPVNPTTAPATTAPATTAAATTAPATTVPTTVAPTDPKPVGFTVYAINSAKWAEVAAHYWGGIESSWPGKLMTKTGETVNGFDVYSITFDTAPQNIIFNNNNKGSQTADLTFQAGKYFDVKGGQWYASLNDVPALSNLSTDRYLAGSFNGWSTVANEFKLKTADGKIGYIELELEANTTYEFKIIREGAWTSCKTNLNITGSASDLVFSSGVNDNTKITTKKAGTYVFAFGIDTSALTVTYPA